MISFRLRPIVPPRPLTCPADRARLICSSLASPMKTDERAFRLGANGEETVGARLEKLKKHGRHVLHSSRSGRGTATSTTC